jgi:subtilisin family serine protease
VGNFDSDVLYPANSNSEILAVGAINQIGKRKTPSSSWDTETVWGSNYGEELDIVAPGVLIPTLDLVDSYGYNPNQPLHENFNGTLVSSDYDDDDYTLQFNGTSSAAPHVSGVAALILSANNGLSSIEVSDIIESTSKKIGGYSYTTETGRSNGTWHEEVGYGLVDAGAAVHKAVCQYSITNTTYNSDVNISDCTGTVTLEGVSISNDVNFTVKNVSGVLIEGTFKTKLGTTLLIDP